MKPTPDQELALESIRTWLSQPYSPSDPFFVLKGYAGTGKSYSIKELVLDGTFKPEEICFTAPTNKAVKVLTNYLREAGIDSPTRTIYSLLGLSLQPNGEVKELTAPEDPIDLSELKLIVVDEGSMVNSFLMTEISYASKEWNLPIIFMGDPAQLPPVGEIQSPIWKIENNFELTKVLRYGNSILDLATSIRKVVDHPFPSIKIETNSPVFKVSKTSFKSEIFSNLEGLKSGEVRVIAWRNIKVNEYNSLIREKLFGKSEAQSPWLPSDKIVATEQLKDLDGNIIMRTDEEAEILEVSIGTHPIYNEFEIFNLLVLHESGKKRNLRVLTTSGQFALNNRLNELSAEAKSGKQYKWKEFWKLKEAFHQVRHSYAITSHRSQGSSYSKVFVDLEDIMLNRNRPEAFRALYVACTRAREEVWVS